MEHFPLILSALAPVFLIMAIGFVVRRRGILAAAADNSLLRLVVYLFYPALIFKFVLGNPALETPGNLLVPPLVGFLTVVIGFGVAYLAAPLFRISKPVPRRTFAFGTGLYNYGYIPIPLIAMLWDSREITGILLVHNVGVEIAFWTAGIILVSGTFDRRAWRRILNPPVIALLVALTANYLGLARILPAFAFTTIDMVAACAIPVGVLLAGATIADLFGNESLRRGWNIFAGSIALRLGMLPLLFILTAVLLPFSPELKKIIIIQAAMPAGIFPIVIAAHYGGDPRVAFRVVLGTTVVALITIPFWISLGLQLSGL